jgi:hypothetical protein
MSEQDRSLSLSVRASAAPNPHLLRAAIEARVGGRPFAAGAEAEVAESVARAVRAHLAELRPGGSSC